MNKRRQAAPPTTARGGSWSHVILLLLMAGFILYGSLFPFAWRGHVGSGIRHVLATWRQWDKPGDLVANIVLYLPLGFFAVQALPSRLGTLRRMLLATLLGGAMAAVVEVMQFHDPARVSGMGDVYADALGAAIGGALAIGFGHRIRWPLVGDWRAQPDAALLLLAFLGYRLYPYVPTMRVDKYRYAIEHLALAPLSVGGLAYLAVAWLLIAAAVEALHDRRWLWLFPLFAVLEFGGRVLVVWLSLGWADVAGAALALGVWLGLARLRGGQHAVAAALFAALVVAMLVDPHAFGAPSLRSFQWLTSHGTLGSTVHRLMPVISERVFLFGGLAWLLVRAGLALPLAIALVCALPVATQFYLHHRIAGLGDAAAALAIGLLFVLLQRGAPAAQRR